MLPKPDKARGSWRPLTSAFSDRPSTRSALGVVSHGHHRPTAGQQECATDPSRVAPAPSDDLARSRTVHDDKQQPLGGHHRLVQQRRMAGGVPVERLCDVRDLDLDVVVVDSGSTDDTVISSARVSRRSSARDGESRIRIREQPRARDRRRGVGPVPQSGHQDSLGDARGAHRLCFETSDGGTRGCQADRRERRHGPDDAAISECPPLALRERRRRAPSVSCRHGSENVCSTGSSTTARPLRLDRRFVHAGTQGGDRRRRCHGRAVLSLLRGNRLLLSDATGRLGGRPSSPDDDLSPEQHDRLGREAEPADGVRSTAVHGEALRARPPGRGHVSRSASGTRSAPSGPAAVRTDHAPTCRRALRARDASRARAASVRLSVVTSRRGRAAADETDARPRESCTGGVAFAATGLPNSHPRGATGNGNRSTLWSRRRGGGRMHRRRGGGMGIDGRHDDGRRSRAAA